MWRFVFFGGTVFFRDEWAMIPNTNQSSASSLQIKKKNLSFSAVFLLWCRCFSTCVFLSFYV